MLRNKIAGKERIDIGIDIIKTLEGSCCLFLFININKNIKKVYLKIKNIVRAEHILLKNTFSEKGIHY